MRFSSWFLALPPVVVLACGPNVQGLFGAGGAGNGASTGSTGASASSGTGARGTGGNGHGNDVGHGGTGAAPDGGHGGDAGDGGPPVDAGPPCEGLQCQARADACAANGKPATTITGKVYDPAGALPLYGVYVYIPNGTPAPIASGHPTCSSCEAPASGSPIIGAVTDANGNFTLSQGAMDTWGVPSGANIPLVLQIGKWRRQVTLPPISACTANTLPDPATASQKLRLPAKSSEGDMPMIAFTSGCDPAECFLRHIGIDDSEFVVPGSASGHVHFYTGQDATSVAAGAAASQVAGGNTPADTYAWWTELANLQAYDVVFNACECNPNDRGAGAYQAMHDYVAGGGRLFATHYYYNWFAPPTGPADFQSVVSWALPEGASAQPYTAFFVDPSYPKGQAFSDWLTATGTSTTPGQIPLTDTRWDMNQVNPPSTRWIYNANSADATPYATQFMGFNAPIGAAPAAQCGRAVYSDLHASGSSDDSVFPNECANADPGGAHQPNERALEFLFFDLASCVQDDTQPPISPPAAP